MSSSFLCSILHHCTFFVSDTSCIPNHFLHQAFSLPRSGELAAMTERFIFVKVSHQVSSVGRHGRQLCLAERVTDLTLGAQQVCSGTSWNTCSRLHTVTVSMLGDISLHPRGTRTRRSGEHISNHYVCQKVFAFLPLKLTISSSCCTQRRIWSPHIGIHCMPAVKHVPLGTIWNYSLIREDVVYEIPWRSVNST